MVKNKNTDQNEITREKQASAEYKRIQDRINNKMVTEADGQRKCEIRYLFGLTGKKNDATYWIKLTEYSD